MTLSDLDPEAFWALVDRSAGAGGCWLWRARRTATDMGWSLFAATQNVRTGSRGCWPAMPCLSRSRSATCASPTVAATRGTSPRTARRSAVHDYDERGPAGQGLRGTRIARAVHDDRGQDVPGVHVRPSVRRGGARALRSLYEA